MDRNARNMCEPCPMRSITQGSIFGYAVNEDINEYDDLGIIISARCDISNNKNAKFSYLPTIKIDKFIRFFLLKKVVESQIKDEISSIKNQLSSLSIDPSIIDIYGIERTIEKIDIKDKTKRKIIECNERISNLRNFLLIDWKDINDSNISIVKKKKLKEEIDNLFQNKIEGYFVIDNVIDHNDENKCLGSHVVIMREVRHIDSDIVRIISGGLIHEDYKNDKRLSNAINIDSKNGMSYVLSNLKSPYIELMMQRFASLYSRIGVEDPDTEFRNIIVENYYKEVLE